MLPAGTQLQGGEEGGDPLAGGDGGWSQAAAGAATRPAAGAAATTTWGLRQVLLVLGLIGRCMLAHGGAGVAAAAARPSSGPPLPGQRA